MKTVLISIITSGVVAVISGIITFLIQERKLNSEKLRLKAQFDLEKEKLEELYKTERRADNALSKFLNHVKFKRRSFTYISEKMGGFDDNELRKMLIRNGAVRSIGKDKVEWWELLEEYKVEIEN